ncbi:VOC family protein [Microbacterium gorillae]|uniref:VOC family protein n=1 Tax=Microbacterium gorillae TaxID=1231063 RepID=UPI00058D831D|nr:VOC family protein [Microbacterium gorillae]
MSMRLEAINITCRDHVRSGALWASILGLEPVDVDPDDPDEYLLYRIPGTDVALGFQPPDDGEVGTDFVPRIHLDAAATVDSSRDDEVAALLAKGLRVVADRREPDGTGWVTMADDDGTEVCVCRPIEVRTAT